MAKTIWMGTDTYIQLTFTDGKTDLPITDATVTAQLQNDETDAIIENGIPMPHVSNGLYESVIPYNQPGLTVGLRVRVNYFADGGTNKRLTKAVKAVVRIDS